MFLYGFFLVNFFVGAILYIVLGLTPWLWVGFATESLLTLCIVLLTIKQLMPEVDHPLGLTKGMQIVCIAFYTALTPMLVSQANIPVEGVYALRILPQFLAVTFVALMLLSWLGTIYVLETG